MIARLLYAGLWAACLTSTTLALVPPSQDPWYQQPENISAYAPGEMIRTRQVANELEPYVPVGMPISVELVHQYLYRTTDSVGKPVAAAATLIVPHNSDPSKLLAYETFYDANNPDCSPSYTLRRGSSYGNGDLLPHETQPLDLLFVSFFSWQNPFTYSSTSANDGGLCVALDCSAARLVGDHVRLRRS